MTEVPYGVSLVRCFAKLPKAPILIANMVLSAKFRCFGEVDVLPVGSDLAQ